MRGKMPHPAVDENMRRGQAGVESDSFCAWHFGGHFGGALRRGTSATARRQQVQRRLACGAQMWQETPTNWVAATVRSPPAFVVIGPGSIAALAPLQGSVMTSSTQPRGAGDAPAITPGTEAISTEAVAGELRAEDPKPEGPVSVGKPFADLGLAAPIVRALEAAGYEAPTPIQARCIPPLLEGKDVLGQAQTGTGKTAAFALPILSRLAMSPVVTRALVLAPTRELAIQVAEAFQTYARHLKGFSVLPIYGGQDYGVQLRHLRRGAHVVVGTPGRVMDHMRRGTLELSSLHTLVLDEADEMLRMGFIDDVEWILEQTPTERQIALFSATMPDAIRRVARRHLKSPVELSIAASTTTAASIRQRYWKVSGLHKLDALTRLLEVEDFEGMLIFVRTKNDTMELAERLTARGYTCEALNGDIAQKQRERTVERLRSGEIDIVVATDVAARGLDVDRISHVVNFDIPSDTESYVHRIGRTGRAGRSGEAILFVSHREQGMLAAIERATRQRIEPMRMPSASDVNEQRVARFKRRISDTLASQDLEFYLGLVDDLVKDSEETPHRIAAALAQLLQGDTPLLIEEPSRMRYSGPADRTEPRLRSPEPAPPPPPPKTVPQPKSGVWVRRPKAAVGAEAAASESPARIPKEGPRKPEPRSGPLAMARFVVDVGAQDGLRPGNLVGAIANEGGIDARYIGSIHIGRDYSTVELPGDLPRDLIGHLQNTWVCGKRLGLRPDGAPAPKFPPRRAEVRPAKRKDRKPKR